MIRVDDEMNKLSSKLISEGVTFWKEGHLDWNEGYAMVFVDHQDKNKLLSDDFWNYIEELVRQTFLDSSVKVYRAKHVIEVHRLNNEPND